MNPWAAGQSVMRWRCRGWGGEGCIERGGRGPLKQRTPELPAVMLARPCGAADGGHRINDQCDRQRSPLLSCASVRQTHGFPRTQTRCRVERTGPELAPTWQSEQHCDEILETRRDAPRRRQSREFWAQMTHGHRHRCSLCRAIAEPRRRASDETSSSRISRPMARGLAPATTPGSEIPEP